MDLSKETAKKGKPAATSTVEKRKRRSRSPFLSPIYQVTSNGDVGSRESSLGILSLDNLNLSNVSAKRLEQYELSRNLVKKTTGLPEHYFNKDVGTPSLVNAASESTVNESDLLQQFVPGNISTPRSSYASDIVSNFEQFKHQLVYSDLSLSKLCDQYSKIGTDLELPEESFVSGDLAAAKIAQQEQSWLKERGVLGAVSIPNDSLFTQFDNCNMTDFFQKKSELAEVCLKDSPEKENVPAALIDIGNKSESIWSFSAFENADTTAKVFNLLRNVGNKENESYRSDVRSRPSSCMNILSDSTNVCDKSVSSVRTVSSLDNLIGGKLPIETNRIELVWGCVQVGKKIAQTFILRNKSHNKLQFQITSSSACFRIFTDQGDADAVSMLPVLLYPAESRCFKVVFVPSTLGAFVETLNFTAISDELKLQQTKRQSLMLFGYGGHAQIDILNVAKDSNMKMWLSFGKFENKLERIQKFTVRNLGTLTAFVSLSFNSKVLFGYSKVVIEPEQFILQPKSQTSVTITFTPTKDDVKRIFVTTSSQVTEIGVVQIISGAEPLRGRIRNLCRKLEKDSNDPTHQLISKLSCKYSNENMPLDTLKFTETVSSMKELMQNLVIKEIMLTIERDTDCTMLGRVAGFDESSMFHSLVEGMTTVIESKESNSGICSIEPSHIVLSPPIKIKDCVLLISHHSVPLQYQTSVSPGNILYISPAEGILSPDDTVVINILCNVKNLQGQPNQLVQVSIYVDNEVYVVDVKIVFLKAAAK